MAYDLTGPWSSPPTLGAQTNLTAIEPILDTLWQQNVHANQVVLGQAWYGRQFTLSSTSCSVPNGKCTWSGPGTAGPCTGDTGTLSYREIANIISTKGITPTWDKPSGTKYFTYNNNIWVTYDDKDTFQQKAQYANSRCLAGLMVWAMDMVDQTANNGFPLPLVGSVCGAACGK